MDTDINRIEVALCSRCFRNEGLRINAYHAGIDQSGPCPNCGADQGRKLDKERVRTVAHDFFVRGTFHRTHFGGAPVIQMNEQHYGKTEIDVPEPLRADVELIEEAGRIGFFRYGPRLWMVGHNEPLKALQEPETRHRTIERILNVYPKRSLSTTDRFYRLRKAPGVPSDPREYDSPPPEYLGTYRLDSGNLPVLYASEDLDICIQECRVTLEDDLYVATLRPDRELTTLDLTEIVEIDQNEFESLDIAVHLLFLAAAHSYGISRDIAQAAAAAGFDGIVYPSYHSVLRTGRMPIESVFGISLRRFKGHEVYARTQLVPNLGLFGRPVQDGSIRVDCVNRLVLTQIGFRGVLGPVEY